MGKSSTYHRTFRPAEILLPRIVTPTYVSVGLQYKHPTFQAIQVDDSMSEEPTLVRLQYQDQNFALHATSWEKYYAQPLVSRNGKPFSPLVSKSGLVIGYCGRVGGGDIWSKDPIPGDMEWTDFEDLEITAHFAILNSKERNEKKNAGWSTFTKHQAFTVVCSIDGEIAQVLAEERRRSQKRGNRPH